MANTIAHLQGIYMSYAFNSPKKYPKKPFELETKAKKKMSDKQIFDNLMGLVKKTNNI
jgi:hypothetical protein